MVLHAISKAGLTGVVSAVSTRLMFGANKGLPINFLGNYKMNGRVPLWAVSLVLGAVASVGSDLFHGQVLSHVPLKRKFRDQASLVIGAVMTGGMLSAAMYVANPNLLQEVGLFKTMIVGGGSEVAGSFINDIIF